jgi:hypothetical protein
MRFKDFKESRQPCWMSSPCRSGNKIPIDKCIEEVQSDKRPTSELNLGRACWIRVQLATFQHARGSE